MSMFLKLSLILPTYPFNTSEFYLKNHVPDVNDGESLGWDSEEGLEINSKDILDYLTCLNGKCDCKSETEVVQL